MHHFLRGAYDPIGPQIICAYLLPPPSKHRNGFSVMFLISALNYPHAGVDGGGNVSPAHRYGEQQTGGKGKAPERWKHEYAY